MISEILEKFAPALSKHGVKLSVEETSAPETTKVEMATEGALADGTKIYSPAAELAEGVEVFVMDASGNPTPLADGEYTLDNGITIVVTNGIIESMGEPMTEEPVVPPADAVEQEAVETYSKQQVESLLQNIISEFETKLSAAEAKIVELSSAPAAVTVKQSRQASNVTAQDLTKMTSQQRAFAIINKYK